MSSHKRSCAAPVLSTLHQAPTLCQNIRQYLGDSRGHWEGDTLVVETTNFTDQTLNAQIASLRSP